MAETSSAIGSRLEDSGFKSWKGFLPIIVPAAITATVPTTTTTTTTTTTITTFAVAATTTVHISTIITTVVTTATGRGANIGGRNKNSSPKQISLNTSERRSISYLCWKLIPQVRFITRVDRFRHFT